MPFNLLRTYNQRLELLHVSERDNRNSIRSVFLRDFSDQQNLSFRNLHVKPTTAEGEDAMSRLFSHLTTVTTDKATNKREFETERSIRIHWIKYHLEERKQEDVIVFTMTDENRIYILDKAERYVIIFEPLRNGTDLYLLTAYHLLPGNFKNIMKKYEKRGREGIFL